MRLLALVKFVDYFAWVESCASLASSEYLLVVIAESQRPACLLAQAKFAAHSARAESYSSLSSFGPRSLMAAFLIVVYLGFFPSWSLTRDH